MQGAHGSQPRFGRALDEVVESDAKQGVTRRFVSIEMPHRPGHPRRQPGKMGALAKLHLQVFTGSLEELRPAAPDQGLDGGQRRLVPGKQHGQDKVKRLRSLRGHRFRGQQPHVAVPAGQTIGECFGEPPCPVCGRRPAHRLAKCLAPDFDVVIAKTGDQCLGDLPDFAFHAREAANRLQADLPICVSHPACDRTFVGEKGSCPHRRRAVLRIRCIAKTCEQPVQAIAWFWDRHAGDRGRRADPSVLVVPGRGELLASDPLGRPKLKRKAADHRVRGPKKLGHHGGEGVW